MDYVISVVLISVILLSMRLWYLRIYRRFPASSMAVFYGPRQNKQTAKWHLHNQVNCILFWFIMPEVPKYFPAAFSILWFILTLRALRPVLRARPGQIVIAHDDPLRSDRVIGLDQLQGIEVRNLDSGKLEIICLLRNQETISHTLPFEEVEFLNDLKYFSTCNNIPLIPAKTASAPRKAGEELNGESPLHSKL